MKDREKILDAFISVVVVAILGVIFGLQAQAAQSSRTGGSPQSTGIFRGTPGRKRAASFFYPWHDAPDD